MEENKKKYVDENSLSHINLKLKTKLDGIEAGANKTVVDSTLSDTSTNAIQNKAVKAELDKKVNAETGKGLSTNDLTDELKAKILSAGDSTFSGDYNDLTNKPDLSIYGNKIESVKVNGVAQTITDKAVNIAVPTNNNQLTNGAGYQTASQVETAISAKGYQTASQVNSAIEKVVGTAPEALDTLKELADALNNDPGFASSMTTELSKKVNSSDLVAMTNDEIDAIMTL